MADGFVKEPAVVTQKKFDALGVPADRPTDNIGMSCAGFLSVPADDLYTFKLRSADASDLRVDGQTVVENESPDFISRFGMAALKGGLHPVEVRYVHADFFIKGLELSMDAPGAPLAPVGPERLFHLKEAR